MVRLGALGSGSGGNALVLSGRSGSIIVDIGFSKKEMCRRLDALQLQPERIQAALLTHEHDDHSKGCRVFCNGFAIPLYATSLTVGFLRQRGKLPERVMEFEPGSQFKIGEFQVEPFAVQHDAINPVGFVIYCEGMKIGIATDLGCLNQLAIQRLRDCDALVLESNYDVEMLINSQRQLMLKRRIMGRNGHLGNVDACSALNILLTPRTKVLLMAHLSRECNSDKIVRSLVENRLKELGRQDIKFDIILQDEPLGNLVLNSKTEPEQMSMKLEY